MPEKPTLRRRIKAVQKWMLDMCDDPKVCDHGAYGIRVTKDGLGVCVNCGDRGVFTISAKEIAEYVLRRGDCKAERKEMNEK